MRWLSITGGVLAAGLALGWGCARRSPFEFPLKADAPPGLSPKPQVIVTPGEGRNGRILSVNPAARYAVVSYGVGVPLPAVGQVLSVYRAGLKVAEIKVSGPSRDSNTVGDILTGEGQVGDEVRLE